MNAEKELSLLEQMILCMGVPRRVARTMAYESFLAGRERSIRLAARAGQGSNDAGW